MPMIPGTRRAGGLRHRDGRNFVALYKRDPGVVLELVDEPYRGLVVSADEATVHAIVHRVTTGSPPAHHPETSPGRVGEVDRG